jgi:hypothetical protein
MALVEPLVFGAFVMSSHVIHQHYLALFAALHGVFRNVFTRGCAAPVMSLGGIASIT